jgi:hypothetical protein
VLGWRFVLVAAAPVTGWWGEVGGGAVDEVAGDVGEPLVAVAGVVAQNLEGMVDVDAETLGELAFGLLDDDPAAGGALELPGVLLAGAPVSLLQQPDCGDVGQGLADTEVLRVERAVSAPNRFSAPMTSSRSRIGTAWTVRNPALTAADANRGHRWSGPARSAAVTACPVRRQSMQGPWSLWTWNSSSIPAASLEAAATRSSPRGSVSSTPAAEAGRSRTLRSVSMCRKSMTSKSATMVSARSTKVLESSPESIWVALSSVAGCHVS